jgi:hypothetical protein
VTDLPDDIPSYDEFAALFRRVAPEVQDEAAGILHAKTGEYVWTPNPGPQAAAYDCLADELFYGGQAGGGKTELGIGLALTRHRRSLILRRFSRDAQKLVERIREILGSREGYNLQLQRWRLLLPDGSDERLIQFAGCEHEEDKQRFKGDPHDLICVGRGTPVLLSDGSYLPVEQLIPGQLVQTLEGPRRLRRVYPVQHKPCVEVVARDINGRELGRQIQSVTHSVLTDRGWLSAAGLADAYGPNLFCKSGKFLGSLRRMLRLTAQRLLRKCHHHVRIAGLAPQAWGRRIGGAACAFAAPGFPGNDCAVSGDERQAPLQPALSCIPPVHRAPSFRSNERAAVNSFPGCERSDAQISSLLAGWPGRCGSYIRRYGARIPRSMGFWNALVDAPRCLLLRDVAERPIPSHLRADASVQTQTHNRPRCTYPHPYRRETRLVGRVGSILGATLEITPIGDHDVFDLHVEEVNHYITSG